MFTTNFKVSDAALGKLTHSWPDGSSFNARFERVGVFDLVVWPLCVGMDILYLFDGMIIDWIEKMCEENWMRIA